MPTIVDVANVMAQTEDYSWNPSTLSWSVPNPNSLAQVNNNPGNLMFAGQVGATPGKGGFAYFPTVAQGFQAEQNQIALDASRGLDFGSFLEKMTPQAQNPNFDQNVPASRLGVSLTDKLSAIIGNSSSSSVSSSVSSADTSSINNSDIANIANTSILDSILSSTGIDITDPTTLFITAAIGVGLLVLFSSK